MVHYLFDFADLLRLGTGEPAVLRELPLGVAVSWASDGSRIRDEDLV